MSGLLLDTNIISLCLNNTDLVNKLKFTNKIYIPLLVMYELMNTFNDLDLNKKSLEKHQKLSDLLDSFDWDYINIDEDTVSISHNLFCNHLNSRCSKKKYNEKTITNENKSFPHIDALIAGIAIKHNLDLFTCDSHFNEFISYGLNLTILPV